MGPVKQVLSDAGLTANQIDKVLLVGGSTRIPAVQDAVRNYMGKEPFKGINPDECVAIGAAVQGGVLGGDVKDILLLDVTPLSLGIETLGGICTKIIERNTTIPTKKSQIFSTAANNQTSVEIKVLQGEREMASGNTILGTFILDGIAPAPRGVPQIEVTFDIDANGIVNVSAKDNGTGKEQHITITSSSNMSKEDIDKAVRDAEKFADEDKKLKEKVETKNKAEAMVFEAEKLIDEIGDKASEEDKEAVRSNIQKVNEALKNDEIDSIKSASDSLEKSIYKLSEKLYSQNNNQASSNDGNMGQDNGNQNYYNGDFEDKTNQ
jgi:molecular chaperone DnaK